MGDVTVLFYTANTEPESFAAKVRERLREVAGHLPIVSVSQKPIDLGENVCVGNRGASYHNEYQQILVGARAARTEWVIAAEADFLYPRAYFDFEPPADGPDIWRYDNVWILWRSRLYAGGGFKRKRNSEGAQWARREPLVRRLEACFAGQPEWREPGEDWRVKVYGRNEWSLFGEPDQPAVSVKSGWGMRPSTKVDRDDPTTELPLWGQAADLREELFRG
jgi:hypothetical protein